MWVYYGILFLGDFMKIKALFKKYWGYILAFVSSLVVISILFYLQGVAPFGGKSLLTIDFFHQYGPMLGELFDRIKSHSSLLYSFNMSMGLPFYRNFFNYLSSPFNVLMLLFNHRELLTSFSVIVLVKLCFSTLFMYMFLKKKVGLSNVLTVCLSLLYSFSAYFVAYYWNIMWLDGMVFLPLIVYGLERMLIRRKPLVYVLSLSVMMFANYFIAYMICIFLVIYFIIFMVQYTDKFDLKKILFKCAMFGINSLIAAVVCAWFLVPMFNGLSSISATSDIFPSSQYYAFNFAEFWAGHFSGVVPTVLSSDVSNAPNIACGVLSILAFWLFIFDEKLSLKTKFAYLGGLVVLFISFYIGQIDFIWHAFHVPNDLPFRYSFVYSFLFVIIAAYGLRSIKDIKPRYLIATAVMMGLSLLLLYLYSLKFENITGKMVLLNVVVGIIYFLLIILSKYYSNMKRFVPALFLIVVSLEIVGSINTNWNISHLEESFYKDYNEKKDILSVTKDVDNRFCRGEFTNMLSFNDPSWYGYYGITSFSSMIYENLAILQHNLGQPGNEINSFYYKQNTPIYDLINDVCYYVGDLEDKDNYTSRDVNGYTLNRFNSNASLFYFVNSNIKFWEYNNYNPFNVQNDFVKRTTNIDDVLEKVELSSGKEFYKDDEHIIIRYELKESVENYYIYNNSSYIDFMLVDGDLYYNTDDYSYVYNLEDINITSYNDYNEKYIINHKSNEKKSYLYVGFNNYYEYDFYVYKLNQEKYNEFVKKLKSVKVNIVDFKEDVINLNVSSKEGTIYSSIPYDDGWHVYINGKEISKFRIGNAFLGFDVLDGDNDIKLVYKIPYFGLGLFISCSSVILLSLEIYLLRKKSH